MNSRAEKKQIVFGFILVLFATCCGNQPTAPAPASAPAAAPAQAADRNSKWAVPIDKPGLPNLHQVTPNLYRGAQPEPEGFQSLQKMGIQTVINFRRFHSDKDDMEKVGFQNAFKYIEIPMNTWDMTDERAARFLSTVENPENLPAFYHCQHGADRTGTMTAVFRIANQGWTAQDALDEMVNGGYGYHEVWTNLIHYLEKFDTGRVRKLTSINKKESN